MMKEALRAARIVVVDDSDSIVQLLTEVLALDGYLNVIGVTDPRLAIPTIEESDPDLLILDLHMQQLGGLEIMAELSRHASPHAPLPILVLTADTSPEMRQRALLGGAKEFLTKPFDSAEALLRVRNLLETRMLHQTLKDENRVLELAVRERTRELEDLRVEILQRLALAAEYRDDATLRHTERVGRTAALLALELGVAPDGDGDLVFRAAQLHDIGKIGIPDAILLKEGHLSPAEFDRMKDHTVIGARILSENRFELLRLAEEIAMTHHERWAGGGYPRGLTGPEIPLIGRVVALADVFDALIHKRPYKQAWSVDRALEEIAGERERQFDPNVVDAFDRIRDEVIALHEVAAL
ncbi:MAG: response regulator [Actinomycetota bacterium]|nr:response regulator [Actinomycetota bacterium]